MLKQKYVATQYAGALVIAGGISVVLAPRLGNVGSDGSLGDLLLWSLVMIFSCVPMTLSRLPLKCSTGLDLSSAA
jgi:hypothetical protein